MILFKVLDKVKNVINKLISFSNKFNDSSSKLFFCHTDYWIVKLIESKKLQKWFKLSIQKNNFFSWEAWIWDWFMKKCIWQHFWIHCFNKPLLLSRIHFRYVHLNIIRFFNNWFLHEVQVMKFSNLLVILLYHFNLPLSDGMKLLNFVFFHAKVIP